MTVIPLPSPQEVQERYPLSPSAALFIQESRQIARNIVLGKDSRKALIVGPCSIHDRHSAIAYAEKFKELSHAVSPTTFLVMRAYVEKPRTSKGWKGLLYDPHLDGSHDIKTGLLWTRELLIELAEKRIPCATEFVDPLAALYFEDLITWGFVGARTSASQPHRQFASTLDIPVGFKNATDGNLESAIHGVLSAEDAHASLHIDRSGKLSAIQSDGNPYCHIVLRGSHASTNYDEQSVLEATRYLENYDLPQRLMIDCSHGNCQKDFQKQEAAFFSAIEQIERGDRRIFGLMLESHLESGSQPLLKDPSQLKYAVSITDPCLDWKTTEHLIHSANLAFSGAFAYS